MLASRVCEKVCCATVALRGGLGAAAGVEAVYGVALSDHVWSFIFCVCTPLEVGTLTLGVFTSVMAG